ncbi:MAG: hypothetical protein JWO82_2315 [Akkermansiaceae bacterium]|nr:hypothetical protein [Akkermansiaceae bacterium]
MAVTRQFLTLLTLWIAGLVAMPAALAHPFFAMDTGITGEPVEVAQKLSDLGYDGIGASGYEVAPLVTAIEKRGGRVWNVYLTLKIQDGVPAVTAPLRKLLADLKGHRSALWIAISEVSGNREELALSALKQIADEAKKSDVPISLYPHAGHWLGRFSQAAALAEKLNRPEVGVTFNLCHWLRVEGDIDPVPELAKQAARLQFVTINGADGGDTKTMDWHRLIQPLGKGSYDVARFVGRLGSEVKWDGPIGLQSFGIPGDQQENLKASMAAWQKMSGTLDGMVFCGYQGWFRVPADGSNNGWSHYESAGKFEPGHANIELWPDLTEAGPDEKFDTPFRNADGSVAQVFSSVKVETVRRHFRWMREYGIDGAFLQRFAAPARDPRYREPMDQVLAHCQTAAAAEGRKLGLMYDLSGLKTAEFPSVIEDWKKLRADGKLLLDGPYLRYHGKPLVTLWGIGFSDRPESLDEWSQLVEFFRGQGCAIMLGVPCYWRTLDRDCIKNPRLLEILTRIDIVSPWSVGRFGTPDEAAARVDKLLKPDLAWCQERGLGYLPVAFPGFSWHNLQQGRHVEAKMDQTPRLDGRFLWSQAMAARDAGLKSVYVAMFDEMDEGTAIFKTSPAPPVGDTTFLAWPQLPSDHYLWVTGQIPRLLRGEIPAAFPERK